MRLFSWRSLSVFLFFAVVSTNSVGLDDESEFIDSGMAVKVNQIKINQRDLTCMAKNIYYEAGSESYVGKIAVGQVVLNRMNSDKFPKTVCGVVHQRSTSDNGKTQCQFTWACGQKKPPKSDSSQWQQSVRAATELLTAKDKNIDILDGAMYYHSRKVRPNWKKLTLVTHIDNHVFYRR